MGQQQVIEVRVPDIGDFTDVPVIDVLVKPGDTVAKEDPLVTLESDKATMEVPSPAAGVVKELKVRIGDKVSEGAPILTLEAAPPAKAGAAASQPAQAAAPVPTASPPSPAPLPPEQKGTPSMASGAVEVRVPDIGDFTDVPVIEVMVKAGDRVAKEDPLITLESDKATMEVPAPAAGVVKEVKVKVGDKVSEGALIVVVEAAAGAGTPSKPSAAPSAGAPAASVPPVAPPAVPARAPTPASEAVDEEKFARAHAGPSVRRLARELGVNLGQVKGSGPKGRILTEDVQAYVKGELAKPRGAAAPAAAGGTGLDLLAWPKVDFTKFGPVEAKPLSRIKKISGANLHRNWVMIPHVTQFDEADITDLEAFRVQTNKEIEKTGVKLTMLAFLIKACVAALRKYPEFNASLDGDNLVLKGYYHIGFAADTPNGLVVPVLKDADRKGTV